MKNFLLSRRTFIQAGITSAVLPICVPRFELLLGTELKDLEALRRNLLQLINDEREVANVGRVELDDFASKIAMAHAEEMAVDEFVSHWGKNGYNPYQRYSFAGGYHATQENISAADNTWSLKFEDLKQDTSYLHVRLYQEQPPNDGHRQAILAPQHTHVGLGMAIEKLRLRVVELFVSKYVELNPIVQTAKPKTTVTVAGRLLKSNDTLNTIEVFYEPLPTPRNIEWLQQPRSYSLPSESQVLKPILPPPYQYGDRQPGVIRVEPDGRFEAPVTLFKDSPGVYTIVCWVKRRRGEKPFPATGLCIRAE
jgi:uncharacterized protein YkwD